MSTLRDWWDDVSHRLFVKTLIFIALLGALWWNQDRGAQHQANETRALAVQVCERQNDANETLLSYIEQQLDRAEKTIPTFSYYRAHPEERATALRNLHQQRRDTREAFRTEPCEP